MPASQLQLSCNAYKHNIFFHFETTFLTFKRVKSNVTQDLPIQETNVLHMNTHERLPFSNAAIKKARNSFPARLSYF